MTRYKVGDKVSVRHIGECYVANVTEVQGETWYILRIGEAAFSISESEIEEKGASPDGNKA